MGMEEKMRTRTGRRNEVKGKERARRRVKLCEGDYEIRRELREYNEIMLSWKD
jgi:hypothetical protein